MRFSEYERGAVKVLKPEGPLRGDDAQEFRDRVVEMAEGSSGRCVVDVSAVQYVDSKGLQALVDAGEHVLHTGRRLKLCGVAEIVRQVLDLTELSPEFEYFANVNAAVRSFL